MNQDTRDATKRAVDRNGIQTPDIWPLYPYLPLKHWRETEPGSSMPTLAVMWEEDRQKNGGWRVAVNVSMHEFAGRNLSDLNIKTYPTLEALISDWKVD